MFARILAALGVVVSLYFSIELSQKGFNVIQEFEQLERITPSKIIGVLEGEVRLSGYVEATGSDPENILTSTHTKTPSVYYRFLEEREERDSDGNTRWVTVRDITNAVDFILSDETGSGMISASNSTSRLSWVVTQTHTSRSGNRRYSEWVIKPGDRVNVIGYAKLANEWHEAPDVTISFHTQGNYTPVITKQGAGNYRNSLGLEAVLYIWGGLSLLILGVYCLIYFLQVHRVLTFLTMASALTCFSLIGYGLSSLHASLSAAVTFVETQHEKSDTALNHIVEAGDKDDDWLFKRVSELKINQAVLRKIYHQQTSEFPENIFAFVMGYKLEIDEKPLNAEEQSEVDQRATKFARTKVDQPHGYIAVILALVLFVGTVYIGFRYAKTKRLIENIPTSKTKGVTFGLTECNGRAKYVDDTKLVSPLTRASCVWYHYRVEEKRGSGKNSKWVTITDETKHLNFYCEDNEGVIAVDPSKAEIITKHRKSKSKGSMRYTEKVIKNRDKIYILGSAKVQAASKDKLIITKDDDTPMILSNYTEQEIMLRKGATAIGALAFSMSALFFSGIFLNGMSGDFSATDYLSASLYAPLFLVVFTVIIHYNDIIFLRQRAARNWSNIQVSLKKRATLIPQLQSVLKKYLEHEKTLLTEIADLRTLAKGRFQEPRDVEQYMHHERRVMDELKLAVEAYPELKSDQLLQSFSVTLSDLETEISLIREGFNDAVMHYNTRIQSFPDVLLASAFKFTRLSPLAFERTANPVVSL